MTVQYDYVDKINMMADKVAASTGDIMQGAMTRYNLIKEDIPGAVAAIYEKTAAMQDVLVKLASVVEQIAEGAAEQIKATQGNADTRIQGAEGVDESTQEELKKMETAVSGDLDNSYMEDAKNEGDITSKKYADAGVGVHPNKEKTTGDIIAAAKMRNNRVAKILRTLKDNK